jgi:hypothetical protein
MLERFGVPNLTEFEVCSVSFEKVAGDAMQSSSMKGNPLPLTEERLIHILNKVCEGTSGMPAGHQADIQMEKVHIKEVDHK